MLLKGKYYGLSHYTDGFSRRVSLNLNVQMLQMLSTFSVQFGHLLDLFRLDKRETSLLKTDFTI